LLLSLIIVLQFDLTFESVFLACIGYILEYTLIWVFSSDSLSELFVPKTL
jgi:hypothetical protein